MATDLGEAHEARSFLVPGYEFAQGSEAKAFDPERQRPLGPVSGPDDLYRLIHREDRYFLPIASSQFLFGSAALFNPSIGENDRPFCLRLQESLSEKPAGSRSTCLTVEGRRESLRRAEGRIEPVPSYASWQTLKGGEAPLVSRVTYTLDDSLTRVASKTVAAQWSGQGALCAVTVDGLTQLLLVEYHVYDDDPDRPDLMKIWASRHTLSAGALPDRDPFGEPLSPSWRQLIQRTFHGFSLECGP